LIVRLSHFFARWCVTVLLLAGLFGLGLSLAPAHAHEPQRLQQGFLTIAAPGQAPLRIYVEEVGYGPPVVLLHGMGGSTYSFRHLIPHLARRHRVIAIDLKGFGRSDKPFDQAYTTAHQAQIVLQVLDDLGLRGVTLVGHSFGGAVAIKAVLMARPQARARIQRLVLMNAPAFPQPLSRQHAMMQAPVIPYLALSVLPPILTARAMLDTPRPRGPKPSDQDAIAYADPLYGFDGKHALITTARQIAAADPNLIIPHYGSIRQPTLLIWCRNDPTVPEETGYRLQRTLPRAQLVVLDGCTHMPAEEAPGDTLRALYSFLRG
jgi:pimeloyl-ACP methyl ester carboxylesterase